MIDSDMKMLVLFAAPIKFIKIYKEVEKSGVSEN